jgi:N-acetylglutamate synthase-like GNAT family acetyltransferase
VAADSQTIKRQVRREGLDPTGLNWRNFHVATDADDQLIGFCQVRRYSGVRELGSLYVRPDQRRQSIGAVLIRACLAEETPPVHLECVAARATYYARFGFHRIARGQAPLLLRLKSLLGDTASRLVYGERIIVMRWDG